MFKVSVIMGVYNGERTIRRAIDSLLSQTISDWKCIICDDCSKDGTHEILRSYQEAYPDKFVLLSNERNSGLAFSLNHCLEYVDTQYLARMDDDDISLPQRLEKELDFLEAHREYGIIGSWADKFDEDGVWGQIKHKEYPQAKDFLWNTPFVHPTVMIRSELLKAAGGYSVGKYTRRCEDYELFGRLYAQGVKGCNIQESLLKYYEGRSSNAKRKFIFSLYAVKVRDATFKRLKLYPKGYLYLCKPIAAWMLRRLGVHR